MLGIISINGCNGPLLLTSSTVFAFLMASSSYVSCSLFLIEYGTLSPGLIKFTEASPTVTATAVVPRYIPIVFPPMRLSFFKSDSDATPVIRDDKTRGIAISLRRFIKIIPIGAIHFVVKTPQLKLAEEIP